jgi:hypothetical protein
MPGSYELLIWGKAGGRKALPANGTICYRLISSPEVKHAKLIDRTSIRPIDLCLIE